MRVAITGAHGFLGWHLACRLRAVCGLEPVRVGRADVEDPGRLARALAGADVVVHVAGVNRAGSDEEVRRANPELAHRVARAILSNGEPMRVVYANSVQAELDNAYGRGKAEAARILGEAARQVGGSLADVLLPNLFGEHGRPRYNSFVATFCDAVARGDTPTVLTDRDVPLLHAQQAAAAIIEAMTGSADEQLRPSGVVRRVSDVLAQLRGFEALYATGEVPSLHDRFTVDLFNTYRSYVFPARFPLHPAVHGDERGDLVEAVRSHGGTSQSFVSSTRPGQTRGEHYHLHKIERFFVVRGSAEIRLRRLLHDEVVTFRLDGQQPGFVDMPTLWVHNIANVGQDDLITVFWTDQLLDPERPDQYQERVAAEVAA